MSWTPFLLVVDYFTKRLSGFDTLNITIEVSKVFAILKPKGNPEKRAEHKQLPKSTKAGEVCVASCWALKKGQLQVALAKEDRSARTWELSMRRSPTKSNPNANNLLTSCHSEKSHRWLWDFYHLRWINVASLHD